MIPDLSKFCMNLAFLRLQHLDIHSAVLLVNQLKRILRFFPFSLEKISDPIYRCFHPFFRIVDFIDFGVLFEHQMNFREPFLYLRVFVPHRIQHSEDGMVIGAGDDIDFEIFISNDFLNNLHIIGIVKVREEAGLKDDMQLN
jgi:hypothetical protein